MFIDIIGHVLNEFRSCMTNKEVKILYKLRKLPIKSQLFINNINEFNYNPKYLFNYNINKLILNEKLNILNGLGSMYICVYMSIYVHT